MAEYKVYTREEIDSVKYVDMVDFLSAEYGYHFYKKDNSFGCVERSSLYVNADKQRWQYWKGKKIEGKGLFSWMQCIERQDYQQVMAKYLGVVFQKAKLVEAPNRKYTKEQIESVAKTDMVDFLSAEYGYHFYKKGNGFSCQEHSSLFINSNRRLWYWNSRGIGGNGIFEWMSKIENQEFKFVMKKFEGTIFETASIAEYSVEHNSLSNNEMYFDENNIPQKTSGKYSNVFAYLTKTRSISSDIITELMKSQRIYQDTRKNAVFANLNENGEVGFWCLRGTNTEKKFTRNAPGSNNPYYGFSIDAKTECDTLYVFEAPIDLLSHCTIADLKYGKGSWHNQNRVALCGVNDTALKNYLSRHENIRTIKFCLDNDEAGRTATHKLMSAYCELGYKTLSICYNNCSGKDINEMLCNYINKAKQKNGVQVSNDEKQITENTAEKSRAFEKTKVSAQVKKNYNYDKGDMGLY